MTIQSKVSEIVQSNLQNQSTYCLAIQNIFVDDSEKITTLKLKKLHLPNQGLKVRVKFPRFINQTIFAPPTHTVT